MDKINKGDITLLYDSGQWLTDIVADCTPELATTSKGFAIKRSSLYHGDTQTGDSFKKKVKYFTPVMMDKNSTDKVLFLDLDGTLIQTASGSRFPKDDDDWKLREGIVEAIKAYAPRFIHVISNQGGIALGYLTHQRFDRKMTKIMIELEKQGILKNNNFSFAYCPVLAEDDLNRKPNPGMLFAFAAKHCDIAYPTGYLMVGDASGKEGDFSDSDKRCAERFGCEYMDIYDFIAKNLIS